MRLMRSAVVVLFTLTTLSYSQTVFKAHEDEQLQARQRNFQSGRELLLNKGVSFDPDELLHDRRSKALNDALARMPEMRESRYETAPLHGVYFADTLYLPEHVQLEGDTVLVTNYVVFEGKAPVIKGAHDINLFPAKPIAVLGTTLSAALRQKGIAMNVGTTLKLPSFALLEGLGQKGSVITIDVSGPQPQGRRNKAQASTALISASWNGIRRAALQSQDTSGATGITGASGTPGGTGADGPIGSPGLIGDCSNPSTGTQDGHRGLDGTAGRAGGNGGGGGQGGTGGNASNINARIADGDLNRYNFFANGGTGGLGGEGGNGGFGGNGGRGGDGGAGVACGCTVRPGNGGGAGHGANGGTGGNGGNGGTGGIGGNGGSITVSLPFNSPGANTSNTGGSPGLGGSGGPGGTGGLAGAAGTPGSGATACTQTGASGSANFEGSTGTTGSAGNAGLNGTPGTAGPTPSVTFRSDPSAGGGTGLPGGCNNVGGDGFNPNDGGAGTDGCSPIIIDTSGNGIQLTSAADGVKFDMTGTGVKIQMGWTAPGSTIAFLALPGSSGVVTNGTQLFGNFTPQPASSVPNGFAALAVYDQPEHGGNGDGVIDENDQVFSSLRLWIDENHDGISQPQELHTLPELGVFSISLNYGLSERRDQFGNRLRFQAKINPNVKGDTQVGRKAFDVFFVTQ